MNNKKNYKLVETKDQVLELLNYIQAYEKIAYDTETTSLIPRVAEKNKIIGFSVSANEGEGYYFPTFAWNAETQTLEELFIDGTSCVKIAHTLISYLVGKKLIMHNASFDTRYTKAFFGINLLPSLWVDTMLAVHTVQEEGAGNGPFKTFALKEIAKSIQAELGLDVEEEANAEQIELKENIKKNGGTATKTNFEIYKADMPIIAKYAAADTDLTLRICNYYLAQIQAEGLTKFFFEEEVMPLYKEVTIPMEERGVKVDVPLLKETDVEISRDLLENKNKIINELRKLPEVQLWVMDKSMAKYPPSNKGNWAQRLVKSKDLKLPVSEKTGKYSLNKKVIEGLPDSNIKSFLQDGDLEHLDPDEVLKTTLTMWKDDNNGEIMNIQSSRQLGDIAFNYMGIKPRTYTKKDAPQFDDGMITHLAKTKEWAESIRIYRKLLKVKSTYIDRFLDRHEDEIFYFYYKQHGTVSGRYGSDAQQLPKPKEEDEAAPIIVHYNNLVRAFLITRPGRVFIDCDYESLEPHVFAHVADDEALKDIFRKGHDFYSTIAIRTEKLVGVSADKKADNFLGKLNPVKRNKAKAYSLGIPYGMEGYALSKTLGIKQNEADDLVEGYLNGFPNLRLWKDNSRQQVRELGYIKSQVGRIRHLTKGKEVYDAFGLKILDKEFRDKLSVEFGTDQTLQWYRDYKNAMNNCMNFQIQSLSGSIVNRAAIAINRELLKRKIDGVVCAQIHDQLVVDVPEENTEECKALIQDLMENTTKLSLKLKAPPAVAYNFRDGH